MKFEKCGAGDTEALNSYLHPIWHEVFDPIMVEGPEAAEYIFATWMNPSAIAKDMEKGYKYGFIEESGTRIGLYSWHIQDDGKFYINKLYLEPAFRGKGLGNRALLAMFDIAREHGCSEAYLNVYYYNERAIKAYLRAGMHVKYRCLQMIGNGITRNDYIMSVDLVRGRNVHTDH